MASVIHCVACAARMPWPESSRSTAANVLSESHIALRSAGLLGSNLASAARTCASNCVLTAGDSFDAAITSPIRRSICSLAPRTVTMKEPRLALST